MKFRIVRADAMNWALQEWQEGGDIVERGRYVGQAKQARWKAPHAFYPSLYTAANALLDAEIGERWGSFKGGDLRQLIADVQADIKAHITAALVEQRTDVLIGIVQERGYLVTEGRKQDELY